jgi:hypothetical protein
MAMLNRITAGVLMVSAVFLAFGCMTGGAELPEDSLHYAGERVCTDTSIDSPTDMACHEDCVRDCGFDVDGNIDPATRLPRWPRAKKYCVCQGGVFIECRCPRPDWYKGALFAPYCDEFTPNGMGLAGDLGVGNGLPCDKEWQQCVGRDIVTGFTPRGAVCLDSNGDGALQWVDGSTEKWFAPEQSVHD